MRLITVFLVVIGLIGNHGTLAAEPKTEPRGRALWQFDTGG
jgi:hypothetical protein